MAPVRCTRSATVTTTAALSLSLVFSSQNALAQQATAALDEAPAQPATAPSSNTANVSATQERGANDTARYALRYSVAIDVPITAVGALAWLIPELAKSSLTGPSCRWCERNPDATRAVNGLDTAVRDGLRWSSTGTAAIISDVIGYGLAPASAIGLTILAGRVQGGGRERDLWPLWDSLIIVETSVLAMDLNQLVKFIALRERPRYQFAPESERAAMVPPGDEILSFFSGHTTFTFALATSAGMVSSMRGYRLAPLVWGVGLGLATSAAYLRIAADRHYFTDVLTGVFVGAGMGVLLPWLAHRPLAPYGLRVGAAPIANGAGVSLSGFL